MTYTKSKVCLSAGLVHGLGCVHAQTSIKPLYK